MAWYNGSSAARTGSEFEAQLLADAIPSRLYDVEVYPYNAVADSFYTDGVATSGSATFTSATASFVAGDVGKTIVILRAGPSSLQDHHTTISAVGSSTSVTLANTAGRSQSSARFYISRGGDSTTAIQAAIDDATEAGGGVVLLPGVGYLTTGLSLGNRVTLEGSGRWATMLHLSASANGPVVTNDQTSNNSAMGCTVRNIRIDGNRARQSDTTTTLASGYTAGNSTLSLTDASSFQNAGSVLIGTNRLIYTSKSGNTLSGVVGGSEGTTDADGAGGATVTQHKCHGVSFGVVPYNTTPTTAEHYDPHFLVENVYIKNVKGDGVQLWGQSETRLQNVVVHYADHFGFRPSFDTWLLACTAETSGRAGYFIRSSDVRGAACKAFASGGNVSAEGFGFFFEGPTTVEEGTKVFSALNAQDNKADGIYVRNAERVVVQGTCSSNGTSSVGTYAGLKLDGAKLGIFDLVCTERVAAASNSQQNALILLETTNTNAGNKVRITHGAVNGSAVGTAIKSGAANTGGNDISINGMGGVFASASVSGSVTVDPYIATSHLMTLTGNITALNAPSNGHVGCELELVFIQDNPGSRTLSGANAVFKWNGAAAPTLTTTASRRDTFRFRFDGTNWYETSRILNVG